MKKVKDLSVVRWAGHMRWFVQHVAVPVLRAKIGYWKSLRKVRAVYGQRPLKVIFVVGQTAKWKCQSLFDLMRQSPFFEPIIALVICDFEQSFSPQERQKVLKERCAFFRSRNMPCVCAYLANENKSIPISDLNPDLVFYSQPWYVDGCHQPCNVANTALTFYVPYYVTNLESVAFSCDSPFCRSVFGYIALNEDVAQHYAKCFSRVFVSSRYLGLGHPALDEIQSDFDGEIGADYVIYAPHWSFDHPGNRNSENYSTFLDFGMKILEFAEENQGIQWVFKPHPTLRSVLERSKAWTKRQVDDYYARWERIAIACYDGTYQRYFKRSRALITDCGSFLVEYACTGKPIVHLISPVRKIHAENGLESVFKTYYQIADVHNLVGILKDIVLAGNDPRRELRLSAVRAAGLLEGKASENIMIYLSNLLGCKV